MKYLITLVLAALAACGDNHHPQYQQPPVVYEQQPQVVQPVIVQQQDQGMSAGTAAVLGGVVGYMAGQNSQSRVVERPVYRDSYDYSRTRPATVTNNTTIIQQAPVQQAPVQPKSAFNYKAPVAAPVQPTQRVSTVQQPAAPVYRPAPAPAQRAAPTPSPAPKQSPSSNYKATSGPQKR